MTVQQSAGGANNTRLLSCCRCSFRELRVPRFDIGRSAPLLSGKFDACQVTLFQVGVLRRIDPSPVPVAAHHVALEALGDCCSFDASVHSSHHERSRHAQGHGAEGRSPFASGSANLFREVWPRTFPLRTQNRLVRSSSGFFG